jgi:uncharacterized protein YdeI (YjbR/CyaY-like superfamily)
MNAKKAETNPKVDAFLRRAKTWQEEFEELRTIILDCQLTEELKWVTLVTRSRNVTSF